MGLYTDTKRDEKQHTDSKVAPTLLGLEVPFPRRVAFVFDQQENHIWLGCLKWWNPLCLKYGAQVE